MIVLIVIGAAVVIGLLFLYFAANNRKVGKKGTADTWQDVYMDRLNK